MELKQGSYTRTEGADVRDNTVVMFHREAIQDNQATVREGRPIFKDMEMVELRFPGNTNTVWDLPVTDEHRQKYARQYEAFLRGDEMAIDGTPIEQLTVLTRAQIKELKSLDIHTIEAAAGLSDLVIQRFMGGYKLRELAKRYLEQAEGLAPLALVIEENDKMKAQINAQASQLEELNRHLIGLQAQLNVYANAPKVPEYVPPGSFGGQAPSVAYAPTLTGPVEPATVSSLDSIGKPLVRRGRPPKARD